MVGPPMRLTDLLTPANIVVPLAATEKNAAIAELVDVLARNKQVADPAAVLEAVLERESTRSTGIGSGLAIPHGKTKGTSEIAVALGKPSTPIEFGSVDGRGVTLICLLASPPDKTGQHLQTLSAVSRLFVDDTLRQKVNKATDAKVLYDLIVKHEDAAA